MKKKLKLEHIATNGGRFGAIGYNHVDEYRPYVAKLYRISRKNNPNKRIGIDLFKMKNIETNEECWIVSRALFIDGWKVMHLYSNDNMNTWYYAEMKIPCESPFYEVYFVEFNVKFNSEMELIQYD